MPGLPRLSVLVAVVTAWLACPAHAQQQLSASSHLGVAPLTVQLTATPDDDAAAHDVAWTVNGQSLATSPSVEHTFHDAGNHRVALTLTDAAGQTTTQSMTITVAEHAWSPSEPVTERDARRFLWQASFGPTDAAVREVMQDGYEAWIDRQLATRPTLLSVALAQSRPAPDEEEEEFEEPDPDEPPRRANYYEAVMLMDDLFVSAPDQLRQRTAWALMQVIPVNAWLAVPDDEFVQHGHPDLVNTYLRHALPSDRVNSHGKYEDLLLDLTFNSAMAQWLTYKGSEKANRELGTTPDENYAREVMQLFTIGLDRLQPDGTPVLDAQGQRLPNYTNQDITEFARVFTGLLDGEAEEEGDDNMSAARTKWWVPHHDFGRKQLLAYPGAQPKDGVIPAAPRSQRNAQRATKEVRAAIRNLIEHPSHAPFLARLMIQRFTTSNPTPGYVRRVAEAYQGNGTYGQSKRSDLAAMIKAILLDDEARNPAYTASPYHGTVIEPLRVAVASARAFDLHQPAPRLPASELEVAWEFGESTGQGVLEPPTVFGFFLPTYTPPNTDLHALGLVAPELQILDEYKALAGLQHMTELTVWGLHDHNEPFIETAYDLRDDPRALARHVAQRLDHGWANDAAINDIARALSRVRGDDDRVFAAVFLTLGHPDFRVLR
ncbi:MAG: DUF1800 family protein [Planctomycetota bacterium]